MRILAVQTDANVLELLVQLLIDRPDYDALAARTADAARILLCDPNVPTFDCALVDADIDRARAIEFVAALRGQSDMPILVITTDTDKLTLNAMFAAGATDVATKPFEITGLRGKIALLAHAIPAAPTDIDAPVARHDPLQILDADAFVPLVAFENYSKQLVRHRRAGSCVFGFAINDIAQLHRHLSPFAFHCMITDLATVINTTMRKGNHLLTYAGDGVFLAIADTDSRPHTGAFAKAVTTALLTDNICDDEDMPVQVSLSAGHALRLDGSRSAGEILAQARLSTEKARRAAEGYVPPLVLMDRIA